MKKIALALMTMGLALMIPLSPASATPNEGVCTALDSGKIDVSGEYESLTLDAPEGFLIDGYCVKAGSINQGLGPEYVEVDPAVAQVTITHSSGKDISHYSLSYTPKPEDEDPTPTPTPTTPTPTPTETTPTPTPTETTPTPTPTETTSTPTNTPKGCVGSGCDTPDELPRTGAPAPLLAGLGALLAALGAAALWLTRKTGSHA